jgi:hypothetical protein
MDVINGREVVYEWSHRAWHPVTSCAMAVFN